MLRRLLPGRCRVSWDWKLRRRSTYRTERNTWATRRTSRGMNIREQLAPRRRDKKEVVAVLAPNPYQRPSTETSYYAFMESPSEVTSRSMVSLSSQGSVRQWRCSIDAYYFPLLIRLFVCTVIIIFKSKFINVDIVAER